MNITQTFQKFAIRTILYGFDSLPKRPNLTILYGFDSLTYRPNLTNPLMALIVSPKDLI